MDGGGEGRMESVQRKEVKEFVEGRGQWTNSMAMPILGSHSGDHSGRIRHINKSEG